VGRFISKLKVIKMDYGTLHDIGDFVANNSGWFIAGGVLGGLYAWNKIYDRTRPVVEGEVVGANFTNEGDSRVKIRTEKDGDLDLLLDTEKFESEISIRIGCGTDYRGRADELERMLPMGIKVRAKVAEKQGLERNVYELLNVYSTESK
jgi:hypothetical protein